MKINILYLALLLLTLSVYGQENNSIQKKGTITVIENGKTREYVFDIDTALINGQSDENLNEVLENLNASFDTIEDTVIVDVSTDVKQVITLNDTTKVIIGNQSVVVIEGDEKTQVEIGGKELIRIEEGSDTVVIKIGKKVMRVVENKDGSVVTFDDAEEHADIDVDWDWDCGKNKKNKKKFKGHYGLMEFGLNTFTNPDYSMYLPEENNFMDLNHNRSTEFNLNVFWQSFGLQKNKGNIGIVTGLGFSWNNYFFAKDVTLAQGNQMVEPIFTQEVEGYGYVDKTKLMAAYLTIPLLFEFHLTKGKNPLYLSLGGIGAIKLGSHTKIKHGGKKDKDFSDFYLVPFRYGGTARLGYGAIYIYGTYYASEMFRDGRGPKMNPYTIGIGFPAF